MTGKRHYLTETIPPGPRAAKDAEKARTRLLSQVDEQRNPRTRATVNQLLDRHLEMLGVEETTLDSYESFVRNHIRPLIGDVPVGRINGEILDSFYRAARPLPHALQRSAVHRAPHDGDRTTATSGASRTSAARWLDGSLRRSRPS